MLYLAGQILAFMLVALMLGAALAWLFLIGPIRRQRLTLVGAGAGPAMPAPNRPRVPLALAVATNVSVLGAAGRVRPPRVTPAADLERAPAEGPGGHPADQDLDGAALADLVPADLVPADLVPADLTPLDMPPVMPVALPDGEDEPTRLADLTGDEERKAAPLDVAAADAKVTATEVATTEALTTETLVAEILVAETVATETLATETAVAERADAETTAAVPSDAATGGRYEAPRAPAALDDDRIAALSERLLRHEERSAAENADLASRLAVAELWATTSETRVSAAERQAASAAGQLSAAQARIARLEAELRGVTDSDDGQDVGLREALAGAEARAARFSARLALARTEAEDAARQAAALTDRLERRQAEWAAERAGLLARITEAEAVAARWAATSGARLTPDTHLPGGEEPAADKVNGPATAASVVGMEGVDDDAPAAGVSTPAVAQDLAALEILGVSAGVGVGDVSRPAADIHRNAPTAAESVVSAAEAPAPAADAVATGAVATEPVATEPVAAAGEQPRRRSGRDVPSWGGPAEPVASTDNLKEIVGIGPVIETRLRALGVTSFRQLAAMGDTDVERLAAGLEGFGSRIVSDDWVGQARELQVRYHNGL